MAKRQAAYQRIHNVMEGLDLPDMDSTNTALALAHLQIEATLAVAQATVELQAELKAIRSTIANLR
jgi:hypothetical protein